MANDLCIVHVNLAKGFRGGERQTVLLIRALAQLGGVKQWLVCRRQSPMRQELSDLDVEFVDARHPWQGQFAIPQVDIVHAHEARAVHWAWLQRGLRRTPYILTRRLDKEIRQNFFNKFTYRNAYMTVAVSSAVAVRLAEIVEKEKIASIPDAYRNLISTVSGVDGIRQEFGSGFVVGHIGALVDETKGQRVLLEAARRLQLLVPEMKFVFVGDGKDSLVLKKESEGMPNVYWVGFRENIGDYLNCFDVFAFPSRQEGMGSSILDAMNFGIPVVASRVGGIPDIISNEKLGLLIDSGDVDSLVSSLMRLYVDKALRDEIASLALAHVGSFSAEVMAKRYLSIYREICL